jgi:dTDP-glucose pyrophosphorylase
LKEWTEILLHPDDTLEMAIKVLHSGGKRIILIVEENRKLLGTVTDGDIRRAIIRHVEMDCMIKEVMNNTPTTALKSDQLNLIMSKMISGDLLHMPIVDEQGVLVGLETLQHLIEKRQYDNPVFLIAGGFGTRLYPLTETTPKPLLNVGTRPILETIIIQFIEAGFHNFYISTHYKSDMIYDYFGDGSTWGVKIEYLYEENPLGTAGSLGLLPNDMPNNLPILMMNADLLTKVDFVNLLDFHSEQGGIATMCIRQYDFQVPYGVVNIEEQHVVKITEKPVQKFFVNAGIYVLNPKLLKNIDGTTYLNMPNLLETQVKEGEVVNVFPIHEYWLDIGRMDEYKKANRDIYTFF